MSLYTMTWTSVHKWIVRYGNDVHLSDDHVTLLVGLMNEEPDLNAVTENGSSFMHFASLSLHAGSLMKFLALGGVRLDLRDDEFHATPLHWAATNLQCKQAVKSLIKLGATVDVQDAEGNFPLHYAADTDNLSAAKYLLRASPSQLDARNYMDQTPLSRACEQENVKLAQFLTSRGAQVDRSHLELAIMMNSSRLLASLLSKTRLTAEVQSSLLLLAREHHKKSAVKTLIHSLCMQKT